MCLHRGMQVCRAELGNASHFRCPYHAWTYRNDGRLVGLPFHRDAYGGEDGSAARGQHAAAGAALAPTTAWSSRASTRTRPPLERVPRRLRFYLDFYTRQSPGGAGAARPAALAVKANWKIGAENFAGDMYHTPHTHASVVEIGLFREPKAEKRKEGAPTWPASVAAPPTSCRPVTSRERLRYVGYPDVMIERWCASGHPSSGRWSADDGFMISAASVFPNLSFVHNWPQVDAADDVAAVHLAAAVAARVGPDETEVLSWFAVDKPRPRSSSSPTRRTSCASAAPGCSSRTTWRTGCRSPPRRRGHDGAAAAAQQPHGPQLERRPAAEPLVAGPGPGRPSSASASTTSARCWRGGPTTWRRRSRPAGASRDRREGRSLPYGDEQTCSSPVAGGRGRAARRRRFAPGST